MGIEDRSLIRWLQLLVMLLGAACGAAAPVAVSQVPVTPGARAALVLIGVALGATLATFGGLGGRRLQPLVLALGLVLLASATLAWESGGLL